MGWRLKEYSADEMLHICSEQNTTIEWSLRERKQSGRETARPEPKRAAQMLVSSLPSPYEMAEEQTY